MDFANNCLEATSLDDLLVEVLKLLLDKNDYVKASKGEFTELLGACIVLSNPLARLSRSESRGKLFSALGEFFWYMSGENSFAFINYYVPNGYEKETEDKIVVKSGYGDRLYSKYGLNQIDYIIKILSLKPTSRRAVIQIYSASDMKENSVPCTCTLQFLVRNSELSLIVYMRSNDAYIGLSNDVFAFTMIQEIVAKAIGVELGVYKHFVGSLHLYKNNRNEAKAFISEGWQNDVPMIAMPNGDQRKQLLDVLQIEKNIRENDDLEINNSSLSGYWRDVCVLFAFYNRYKNRDFDACEDLKADLASTVYSTYLDDKLLR